MSFTHDSPQVIACKKAGKELYNILVKQNVLTNHPLNLTGVGVGVSKDGAKPVINIYCLTQQDANLVPLTFCDGTNYYEVIALVSSEITKADK